MLTSVNVQLPANITYLFKEYCDHDETTGQVSIGTKGNRDIVDRFKRKFIKEAQTLFWLSHPNIVRIHNAEA